MRFQEPGGLVRAPGDCGVGYDRFLSKRTEVYAVYSYDKQTGSGSANTFGIGVRHTF